MSDPKSTDALHGTIHANTVILQPIIHIHEITTHVHINNDYNQDPNIFNTLMSTISNYVQQVAQIINDHIIRNEHNK